jgi:hypothetical protein
MQISWIEVTKTSSFLIHIFNSYNDEGVHTFEALATLNVVPYNMCEKHPSFY